MGRAKNSPTYQLNRDWVRVWVGRLFHIDIFIDNNLKKLLKIQKLLRYIRNFWRGNKDQGEGGQGARTRGREDREQRLGGSGKGKFNLPPPNGDGTVFPPLL